MFSHPGIGKIDNFDIRTAMNITVLALEGVFDTGLSIILDALTTANELASLQKPGDVPFSVSVAGVRPQVLSAQKMAIAVRQAGECPDPDLVIIPALGYKMPGPLESALGRDDVADAVKQLRSWAKNDVKIAAACIGTFVLGETGLLAHHDVTTTWWLTPLFRKRYPEARIDMRRMVVSSGPFVTAEAALSHMDLMLWLIRQTSPELAAMVARYLIVDSRPSQAAYIIPDHLSHDDAMVKGFDNWARKTLKNGFSLDDAAASLVTSKRTLARRIQDVVGKTPLSYVQDLRIERAVHLLKTTEDTVDGIAEQVGYADGVTLRTLLRRRLGKGVREIRGKRNGNM
jgi:transcriptional regulator GlxA family with amidase domain